MMKRRILVIEDEAKLARVLRDNLVYEGFEVETAGDGTEGLRMLETFAPHLLLLDLMLPGLDGFEVCRRVARKPSRLPIIILSARSQDEDKVLGLELGADDYVTKPFSVRELLARVRAVFRRFGELIPEGQLRIGGVIVDFDRSEIVRDGVAVPVTEKEIELLRFLVERPGRTITRDELLQGVWGYNEVTLTRTVDNFIARLRQKLADDSPRPRIIQTVYGTGYRFMPAPEKTE
jgi:two-component system alkaline phosphatase synthesis response regulator PhoP